MSQIAYQMAWRGRYKQQLTIFRPTHFGDLSTLFGDWEALFPYFFPVFHVEDFEFVLLTGNHALIKMLVDADIFDRLEDSVAVEFLLHFALMGWDVTQIAVGETNHQVTISEEAVLNHSTVFGLKDQLERLLVAVQIEEKNISLVNNCANRTLLLILLSVFYFESCPMNFFWSIA